MRPKPRGASFPLFLALLVWFAGCASWQEYGFSEAEAVAWEQRDFSPDQARAWSDAGFEQTQASVWRGPGFTPAGARAWRAAGFGEARTAWSWRSNAFVPAEAARWSAAGFEPRDAYRWRAQDLDAEQAREAERAAEVEPLVALLLDAKESSSKRKDALERLESLGWNPSDDGERLAVLHLRRDFVAMLDLGPSGVYLIAEYLGTHGPGTKGDLPPAVESELAAHVAAIEDPAYARALMHVLARSGYARLQRAAIGAFEKIGGDLAFEALVWTIASPRLAQPERAEAARAMGRIGDERSAEILIAALDLERAHDVVPGVLDGLALLDDEGLFEALVAYFRDPARREPGGRATYRQDMVLDLLGGMGDPRAVDVLIEALDEQGVRTRRIAAKHLGSYPQPLVAERLQRCMLVELEDEVRKEAVRSFVQVDRRAVEKLIHLVKDHGDHNTMVSAGEAIHLLGDERVYAALVAALFEGTSESRIRAARGLHLAKWDRDESIEDIREASEKCVVLIISGRKSSETVLIQALWLHGNVSMARTFANCGNVRLSNAATEWAGYHGYTIIAIPSSGEGGKWGGG